MLDKLCVEWSGDLGRVVRAVDGDDGGVFVGFEVGEELVSGALAVFLFLRIRGLCFDGHIVRQCWLMLTPPEPFAASASEVAGYRRHAGPAFWPLLSQALAQRKLKP